MRRMIRDMVLLVIPRFVGGVGRAGMATLVGGPLTLTLSPKMFAYGGQVDDG